MQAVPNSLEIIFEKYILGKVILIADAAASSRSALFSVFQRLGAKSSQLILVNSFAQALEQIPQIKPLIIVAEYDLGNRCGLDLLQTQREQRPNDSKECLFLLATGNMTQTAVARAVEEDIDAYVLKPFVPQNVCKSVLQAAARKLRPPAYVQEIEQGKLALNSSKLDEAEHCFARATLLDPTPALAHFYLGHTDNARKNTDNAKQDFLKGLEFNKIHYRCLIGLYDAFRSQNEHAEAYGVVRKIAHFFPANPKRLEEVVRLAIITGNYADLDEYYKLFITLDERNQSLIRHVCSALVVCGMHFLSQGDLAKATALFEKAAISGVGQTRILLQIVASLAEYKHSVAATKFMGRFRPETCTSDDFLLARFLSLNAGPDTGKVIDTGQMLIRKGLVDERLYLAMIERYFQANMESSADEMLHRLNTLFPPKKTYFAEIFKKRKAAAELSRNSRATSP